MSAPGRVNLIGEHTDYSGLPVLPMAIDRRVKIAAAAGSAFEIHSSTEPVAFSDPASTQGWHRYLAGVLLRLDHCRGMVAVVDSDLPATGGLSSSSALSMAFAGACVRMTGRPLDPAEVAAVVIEAERLVGVESGAMDQTIIAHGRPGHALRIDFPVEGPRWRPVPLPDGLAVVVAYSGTPAHKGANARHSYNQRVVACRLATVLLAERAGVELSDRPRLGEVADLVEVTELASTLPDGATAREVGESTGRDPVLLTRLSAGSLDPDEPLPIRVCATHVLTEARRVDEAEMALTSGDLVGFGRLVNTSHLSLSDFGASTPALDRLVEAMTGAGAYGARLTGAGFGGNAIAVCPPDRVAAVIEAAERATGGPALVVEAAKGIEIL